MIPELFFGFDMGPIVTHKIRLAVSEAGLSILFYVVLCLQHYRSAVMHQSVVVQKTWHGGQTAKSQQVAGISHLHLQLLILGFWVSFFACLQ